MVRKNSILLILFLSLCCSLCFGERKLERAEILEILEQLT